MQAEQDSDLAESNVQSGGDPEELVRLRARVDELERENVRLRDAQKAHDASSAYLPMLEHSPVPVWISYRDRVEFINQAALRLLKAERPEQVLGRPLLAFIHPDSHEALRKRMEQVNTGNGTDQAAFEEKFVAIDGSLVEVEAASWSVSYKGARALLVSFMDLTARKRVGQALRESDERFRQLAENIPQIFYISDLQEPRMVYISPAYETIWDRSCQSLYTNPQSFFDCVYSEDRQRVLDSLRRQVSGEQTSEEYRIVRQDGTLRWIWDRAFPLKDAKGNVWRVAGIAEDISQRKHAEEAIRESEQRYRSLAESLPQLVWTALPDGYCDYLSSQWVTYTGVPESEQLGSGWLKVLHPEDRDLTAQCWLAAVEKRDVYDLEYRIRGAEGAYRWFKTLGTPVRNSSGQIVKWFGSCTDIDDQKRVEQALRHANEDLNQFAYAASHDLQEPLRAVSIYSQMLKRKYEGSLDETAVEFIRYISGGANRMERLLKDLLLYSRLGVGVEEPAEEEDASAAVRQAILNLDTAIRDAGAEVICGRLPRVRVHQVHLLQLFQNLLGNAIKYRSEAPPRIQVQAVSGDSGWVFRVKDNGIGINPRHAELVFGVFKRLHGQKYEGTGVGLALCKRIVERYGGRIWVESEIGQGSSFYFTLPVTAEARK